MPGYGYSLYYPYIHFQNDNWLKLAALYYDGLKRIVPDGFQTQDSYTARALREGIPNFIEDLPPDDTDQAAQGFLDFAQNNLTDPTKKAALLRRMRTTIPTNSTFRIHAAKMSVGLRRRLPRLGLAKRHFLRRNRPTDWYDFEAVTGALYMTYLANKMAASRALPVLSDDPIYQPLIRSMQNEFDAEAQLAGKSHVFASFVIQSTIPDHIETVPVHKIVEFRSRHDNERRRFYDAIEKMAEAIPSMDDKRSLNDCLHHHKKQIDDAVKELRGSFLGTGLAFGTGLLGLSVPSWASTLSTMVAAHPVGILAVGVVSAAFGVCLREGINFRSKQRSPWTYILSLQKGIAKESFLDSLSSGMVLL